ncbi:MAG: helix-turn-helix transcriptional regulator, partial [Anaerolineae bacterium]|nr:helix-turn-helix transcriptional regulator [Anaerolineae bacterium]
MNQEMSFGMLVKEHRRLLDLTQAELARRVGCATITLRKIEADALRPSVQIAERLAMALAVPLEERAAFVRLGRMASLADQSPPSITSTRPSSKSIPAWLPMVRSTALPPTKPATPKLVSISRHFR